jgi:hypothetical protein
VKRLGLAALRLVARGACALRPDAVERSPARRSVLDDIAVRRPWNLVVKAARLRARVFHRRLAPGVTVVIVNWNTREVTADVLRAVRRSSPPDTRVLVLDNGSTDGSRDMLRAWPGIDAILLPANAGHGVALDLGVCGVRTTIAVTLDSDAVPLGDGWLSPAVEPVRSGAAVLAGTRSSRDFVHPIYLALDVRAFVTRRLSFQVHRLPQTVSGMERWGVDAWDTAELMATQLLSHEIVFVEKTDNPVEGLPGMTAGGVVYHHGGVSRAGSGEVTADALAGWRAACHALGVLDIDHETDKSRAQG